MTTKSVSTELRTEEKIVRGEKKMVPSPYLITAKYYLIDYLRDISNLIFEAEALKRAREYIYPLMTRIVRVSLNGSETFIIKHSEEFPYQTDHCIDKQGFYGNLGIGNFKLIYRTTQTMGPFHFLVGDIELLCNSVESLKSLN